MSDHPDYPDYPTSTYEEFPEEEKYRQLTPVEWAYHVPEMLELLHEASLCISDSVDINWSKDISQEDLEDSREHIIMTNINRLLAKLYSRKYHERYNHHLD